MRIPVLAFAFCMLMAPCASNAAMSLKDYDRLTKESYKDDIQKALMSTYLLGIANAIDLMNKMPGAQQYCPPEKLNPSEDLIRQAIEEERENELELKKFDLDKVEFAAIMGLIKIFPCGK